MTMMFIITWYLSSVILVGIDRDINLTGMYSSLLTTCTYVFWGISLCLFIAIKSVTVLSASLWLFICADEVVWRRGYWCHFVTYVYVCVLGGGYVGVYVC